MTDQRLCCGALGVAAVVWAACGPVGGPGAEATDAPPVRTPLVRVLGTVQDGGLPHAACACDRCERARTDPTARRRVAALALVLPSGAVYLVDATPDLREQLVLLRDVRDPPGDRVDRTPVDGVLLTHAHVGHYLGLAFFGFEAVHTRALPVLCTPRMAAFLRANAPWSRLVERGNVDLRQVDPGTAFSLDSVRVTPRKAPHRDELSDTVGYELRGPRRTLLYVPDTDSWDAWTTPLAELLASIDVALLDGTFYSLEELPGRSVDSIGHPLITTTMDLLQGSVDAGTLEVWFTHLNHSNPALDEDGPQRAEIRRRGFRVLEEGQEIAL